MKKIILTVFLILSMSTQVFAAKVWCIPGLYCQDTSRGFSKYWYNYNTYHLYKWQRDIGNKLDDHLIDYEDRFDIYDGQKSQYNSRIMALEESIGINSNVSIYDSQGNTIGALKGRDTSSLILEFNEEFEPVTVYADGTIQSNDELYFYEDDCTGIVYAEYKGGVGKYFNFKPIKGKIFSCDEGCQRKLYYYAQNTSTVYRATPQSKIEHSVCEIIPESNRVEGVYYKVWANYFPETRIYEYPFSTPFTIDQMEEIEIDIQ